MSNFYLFALLGILSGALTSLLAVGMVVAYRGSRVVNFAQGAIAMVGTYVFFSLHVTHQMPYVVSAAAGVAVSGVISVALHLLVLDRLHNSPQVTKVIATLGALALLNQTMTHIEPAVAEFVPSGLPTKSVSVFGASVPEGQVIILGIVIALTAVIGMVYRYTQLGRATAAALDNRRALSSLGYSPSLISAVNWLISGCVAGVAGILLAPISGLSVSTYSLLVLPALAAAVLGRFTSMPLALLGGLVLGALQSEMGYYIHVAGWSDAAPFLVILVVLVVRGVGSVPRSAPAQRLPRVGSGRLNPRLFVPALAIALVLSQVIRDQYWLAAIAITAGGSIVLLSFVIITGYSGQLALSQFAFAGLGAWGAGKLIQNGFPIVPAVIVAVLGVIPLGVVLGFICLRTSGVNLAIATLGFAATVEYLVFDNASLTGAEGVQIGTPHIFGIDISAVDQPNRYAAIAVLAFTLAAVITTNVRRDVSGRRLLALRANERAAASLGVDVTKAKLFAFAIGSSIAALGGVVLAFANPTLVFDTFSTLPSVQAVAQAILGGVGWIGGSVVGGTAQQGGVLSQALTVIAGANYASYVPLVAAVLLLLAIVFQPDGAAPIISGQLQGLARVVGLGRLIERSKQSEIEDLASAETAHVEVKRVPLRVEGLSVSFGGSQALKDLTLVVNPGEIVGLIGPNGAGKSTAIDAVSGYVAYQTGHVTIGEESLDRLRPSERAQAGLRRSFQSLELFDDLTVLDNLAIATAPTGSRHFFSGIVKPTPRELTDAAWAAVKAFGLGDVLDKSPGDLTYGTRRLVAIARAVAAGPSVLMLDEPAAGLDGTERQELATVLVRLAHEWGVGVLLVEHDVPMVMSICERVYALDLGRLIASGPADAVRDDPQVVTAFLGSEADSDTFDQSQEEATEHVG